MLLVTLAERIPESRLRKILNHSLCHCKLRMVQLCKTIPVNNVIFIFYSEMKCTQTSAIQYVDLCEKNS
jgi:hypothetical protein